MHCVEILIFLVLLKVISGQNECHSDSIQEGFQYITFSNGSGSLLLVGDVNDVLQGIITDEINATVWTHETTGAFGFGAAAVGRLEGLGEAIFANGIAFVRQTDNGTQNYFQTTSGNEFRSPFSLFVSKESSPDGYAIFFSQSDFGNIPIISFYEKVYAAVSGQPFCFYGLSQFAQLEGIAVSKAPIYREPLFGDTSYYTQPNFQLANEYGLLFGCAANFSNIKDSALNDKLLKLLYLNPNDIGSKGELQIHGHALTLAKCLTSTAEIDDSTAHDVYHILSNATISYISAEVYVLSSSAKLVDLTPKNNAHNNYANVYVLVVVALSIILTQY